MKKTLAMASAVGLTLLLAGCKHELSSDERGVAEHGALMYANSTGAKFGSCSGLDSDGDGYVTCSVDYPPSQAGARSENREIVCSYGGSPGCKTKR